MPKHKSSLFNEIGCFMSYYKRKKIIRKFYENYSLKTSPRPFYVCRELGITSIKKLNF